MTPIIVCAKSFVRFTNPPGPLFQRGWKVRDESPPLVKGGLGGIFQVRSSQIKDRSYGHRYRMLVFLCLIFGASASWAGALKVSESEIQYGNLKEGPPVVKKVVMTNTSGEDLPIANVKTS